jgi:hypothetical protein
MKCKLCGKSHSKDNPHYEVVDKLSDKGFPTHDKKYKIAHNAANRAEIKKYGRKAFSDVGIVDRHLGHHELAGKNTKTGKIEVSKKVPKKMREEVAYHEEVENKILRKKK